LSDVADGKPASVCDEAEHHDGVRWNGCAVAHTLSFSIGYVYTD